MYCQQVLPWIIPLYLLIFNYLPISEPQRFIFIHIQSSPFFWYVNSVSNKPVACGDLYHWLASNNCWGQPLHLEDKPPHVILRSLNECESPVASWHVVNQVHSLPASHRENSIHTRKQMQRVSFEYGEVVHCKELLLNLLLLFKFRFFSLLVEMWILLLDQILKDDVHWQVVRRGENWSSADCA